MLFLARRLFGAHAAIFAALLTAFCPYLLWLSVQTTSESLFLLTMVTAVFFGLQAADLRSPSWSVAGRSRHRPGLFGAATVIALLPLTLLLMGLTAITRHISWRTTAGHMLILLACFLLMAFPNIAFLYRRTGHLLLDGKSTGLRVETGQNIAGINSSEAAYGIDQDLNQTGFELDHTAFTTALLQGQGPQAEPFNWQLMAKQMVRSGRRLADTLVMATLPFLTFLALLGLSWLARRDAQQPARFYGGDDVCPDAAAANELAMAANTLSCALHPLLDPRRQRRVPETCRFYVAAEGDRPATAVFFSARFLHAFQPCLSPCPWRPSAASSGSLTLASTRSAGWDWRCARPHNPPCR